MSENLKYQFIELATVIFEIFIVAQYISGFFDKKVRTRFVNLGYILFCIGLSILSLTQREPMLLAIYTLTGVFALEFFLYDGNKSSNFFRLFSSAF